MRNIFAPLAFIMFATGSANLFAQEKPDSISIKIPALKTNAPTAPFGGIRTAPDQVGFGKLGIDTDNPTRSNFGLQPQKKDEASYMTVRLYMALHEKDFNQWENKTFSTPVSVNIDLRLGDPPKGVGGLASLLRLFLGKDFGTDPHQMSAADRLKFEAEWQKQQIEQRKRKQQEKQDENNEDSTFSVPLHDIITDYLRTADYVRF